ncbi:MAG TPA: transcription termination factor Rho, partial [Bacillota bacterium]|nr:transcription termination factor Rho [Bacillota bacterium]
MSQLNLHGKTKADLTVIAQVAGLLTASEARKMTKKQLLDYLLQEEDKIAQESADKEADAAAESGQATDITVTPEAASLDISAVKVESEIPAKETDAKTADKKEVKPSVRKSKDIDSKEKTSPAKEKVPAKKDKTSPAKEKVPAKKGPSAAGKDEVSAEKDQPVAAKDEVPAKKDKAAVAKNEVSTEKDKTAAAKDEVSAEKDQSAVAKDEVSAEKDQSAVAKDEVSAEKDQPAAAKEKSSSAKDKASSAKDASSPDSKGSKRTRSMKSTGKKTAELSEAKAKDEQELDVDVNDFSEKPSTETSPQVLYGGVLEIMQDNYGFLRRENYLQSSNDIYVPPQYIRRFNLRTGDYVVGPVRKQRDDRYQALYYVKEVNGLPPDQVIKRPHFDRLTPVYPNERYVLETSRQELSTRIIDLVAPIGKGQRGMIVSPPKAGKTIILQKIAKAIATNNPEAKLIVLLIDERPEEVTDMQRSIDGEVVYSTFDKTPENHVKVTELVLERAMRLVEMGQDVVILLDSITRMGRAYNLTITPTGRTLS